ncbi:MAG: DnrO protein [Lysobacterales bacterium]
MKFRHVVTVVVLCAFSVLPWASLAAKQHHHDANPVAAAAVPAQRWTPDAPLREGMRRAHAAVDELRHYEMGHMSAPMAVDRAATIEEAVTFMFAHCKLAPAPDAALHGVLVPLLDGAQALRADPKNLEAIARMREAIAHYPQYFNDPGWDSTTPVMHEMHDEP